MWISSVVTQWYTNGSLLVRFDEGSIHFITKPYILMKYNDVDMAISFSSCYACQAYFNILGGLIACEEWYYRAQTIMLVNRAEVLAKNLVSVWLLMFVGAAFVSLFNSLFSHFFPVEFPDDTFLNPLTMGRFVLVFEMTKPRACQLMLPHISNNTWDLMVYWLRWYKR